MNSWGQVVKSGVNGVVYLKADKRIKLWWNGRAELPHAHPQRENGHPASEDSVPAFVMSQIPLLTNPNNAERQVRLHRSRTHQPLTLSADGSWLATEAGNKEVLVFDYRVETDWILPALVSASCRGHGTVRVEFKKLLGEDQRIEDVRIYIPTPAWAEDVEGNPDLGSLEAFFPGEELAWVIGATNRDRGSLTLTFKGNPEGRRETRDWLESPVRLTFRAAVNSSGLIVSSEPICTQPSRDTAGHCLT